MLTSCAVSDRNSSTPEEAGWRLKTSRSCGTGGGEDDAEGNTFVYTRSARLIKESIVEEIRFEDVWIFERENAGFKLLGIISVYSS